MSVKKIADNQTIITPWGPLGYITYKRTYARHLNEDTSAPTEEYADTIDRIMKACDNQLNVGFTDDEKKSVRQYFMSLKCSTAGRFLWQLGTNTVEKLGLLSLQNCAFTTVDEPVRPFTWAFDALMLGSGVGYNIQREFVYEIPKVKVGVTVTRKDTNDADFIVPDSREGWVELLQKTLEAFFLTGKSFSYSVVCIRSKGSPIKTFGGTASGPEDLCRGIGDICGVLHSRAGKKVRPIDCLDIMNIIGYIVVSGNVRRSAQIAIGDFDDRDFLKAKRWDLGSIPNWRAMSNNSVVCNDFSKLPEEFWDGYIGKGEPYGLINLRLSRKIGRLGDDRFPDKDVQGYNPSLRRGTKVWTSDGIKEIQDLQDSAFTVKNLRGESADAKCWLSGNDQELYEITLENGFKYYSTAEHKWPIYTEHGYVRCETTELKPGHMLPITQRDSLEYGSRGSYEDGFAIGWLYGDGWVTKRKDDGRTQYGWICSLADMETGIDKKLAAFLQRVTGHEHTGCASAHGVEFNSANKLLNTFMLGFGVSHKSNGLPSSIWSDGSEDFRKGFIDALFSADGTVDSNYKSARILLSQSNQKLITDTAELLGFYGIKNSMDTFVVTNAKFPNGKDYQKNYTRHTLRISTRQGIEHFRKIFTLSHTEKQRKLETVSKAGTKPLWGSHYYIKSVTKTTLKEDVWDVAVFDDTHCFQLSQCITGNCGEQSLNDKETCALGEVFLPNITSKAELQDVVNQLYRIIKHSLILPCHLKETEKVVHKNMRMGIGVTGYLQATAEQKSWLPDVYEALREFDKVYSSQHGWNESIKLTTCKPSGTLSLLAGVTSGIHPGYSRHYIRRIRISSSSPLVDLCRRHGYSVEYQKNFDMSEDHNTVVVSFPCKHTDETVIASDVSAIDQMEWVKKLQTDWSDNSVSCTVYYKKEELPGIKEWLANNFNHSVKTISFLLHSEHGFIQAPLEEITAEEFVRLSKGTKPITQGGELNGDEGIDLSECIGGVCPIR